MIDFERPWPRLPQILAAVGFWIGAISAITVLCAALWFAAAGAARAHHAPPSATQPLGWAYGYECCSLKDCRQSHAGEVTVGPDGYRIAATGEVIPYNDRRIKRSRDEFYHQCVPNGDFSSPRSLCLYVPDQGF